MLTEHERLIDAAVRAFKRDNPLRWPCACIGCTITIKTNFRILWELNHGEPPMEIQPQVEGLARIPQAAPDQGA